MADDAQKSSAPSSAKSEGATPKQAPPRRRLRNYLLEPAFQLKYTGAVVLVTVVVASVLGYFAYSYSKGQTEMMTIMQASLDPDPVLEAIQADAHAADQRVLLSIIGGVAFLVFSLGLTGIYVTHKVVGPAYKMRLLINEVAAGHLRLAGRLRKGDELQHVFLAFANMVESLREAQAREVAELDAAIEKARETGADEATIRGFVEVRDRMNAALD